MKEFVIDPWIMRLDFERKSRWAARTPGSKSAWAPTLAEAVWKGVARSIREVWMPAEVERLREQMALAESRAAACGIDTSGWGCD